jgi:hypothetical protein
MTMHAPCCTRHHTSLSTRCSKAEDAPPCPAKPAGKAARRSSRNNSGVAGDSVNTGAGAPSPPASLGIKGEQHVVRMSAVLQQGTAACRSCHVLTWRPCKCAHAVSIWPLADSSCSIGRGWSWPYASLHVALLPSCTHAAACMLM